MTGLGGLATVILAVLLIADAVSLSLLQVFLPLIIGALLDLVLVGVAVAIGRGAVRRTSLRTRRY